MQATFTKLRNGNWGARVVVDTFAGEMPPTPGVVIDVMRKSGQTVPKALGRCVWADEGAGLYLCALVEEREAHPDPAVTEPEATCGADDRGPDARELAYLSACERIEALVDERDRLRAAVLLVLALADNPEEDGLDAVALAPKTREQLDAALSIEPEPEAPVRDHVVKAPRRAAGMDDDCPF